MNDSTYNGWSNYETWCANLWLDNDGTNTQEMAEECMQEAIDAGHDASEVIYEAAALMADRLEETHDEAMPEIGASVFSDLLRASLGRIDWREIAQSALSEVDVYVARWNLPGCIPDDEPALFLTFEEAKASILEDIKGHEDSEEDEDKATALCHLAEEVNLCGSPFVLEAAGVVYVVDLVTA